jgi:hypothetical protein
MSDATRRQARAARARIELEETEAAFERMKANALKKWLASKPSDVETREELYRLVHVIDTVRAELNSLVTDGLMAEHEAELEKAKRPG